MCSEEHHLEFLWPYLLTGEPIKRSLITAKSWNDDTGIWSHNALFTFYNDRETRAEIRILNLLMHRSPRETGGIERITFRPREPTDAEIVFGNCDCEKLLCTGRSCKTGWDKSRIDWLWDLEHLERQDQLHYIWREHGSYKPFPRGSPVPSVIQLRRTANTPPPKKTGCWSWLRHSCGYVSDTEETLDAEKSAISL